MKIVASTGRASVLTGMIIRLSDFPNMFLHSSNVASHLSHSSNPVQRVFIQFLLLGTDLE